MLTPATASIYVTNRSPQPIAILTATGATQLQPGQGSVFDTSIVNLGQVQGLRDGKFITVSEFGVANLAPPRPQPPTAYIYVRGILYGTGSGEVIAAQPSIDYTIPSDLAGFAPITNPHFTGAPTAPTPASNDNSTRIATTAYVQSTNVAGNIASVFGRTGIIVPTTGDYTVAQVTGAAPLDSPAFTGVPTAPTPAGTDSSTAVATTAYVKNQNYVVTGSESITSVFGRIGAVGASTGDYSVAQITGAAPLDSPTFIGTPTAPTPTYPNNTTLLATTAYVTTALASVSITGYAPLDSPNFVGAPTSPTPTVDNSSTAVATTAFVKSQNYVTDSILNNAVLTGTPTAPTPVGDTGSTSIATTQYVQDSLRTGGGVLSFNARAGDVVPITGDYTWDMVTGAAQDSAVIHIAGTETITGLKTFQPDTISTVGVIFKALLSQSEDLTEWVDNTGAVLARISANGTFTGSGAGLSNIPQAAVQGLAADLANTAHLPGIETFVGEKTFAILPILPTQNAHAFWAGPTTGAAAVPTFRPIANADIPLFVASGTGHTSGAVPDPGATSGILRYLREDAGWATAVSSIAIAVPTGEFAVSGGITTSGTITISKATQNANTFWAGPTTGAAAVPTFRSIIPTDMPVFVASGSSHATGTVPDPGATSGTLRYLREDATWDTVVTSITVAVPAEFTASTGITTSGTITIGKADQVGNAFWAGPDGVTGAPVFRRLVAGDIPTAYDTLLMHLAGGETVTGSKTFSIVPTLPAQTANTILAGPTTGAAAVPTFRSVVPADMPVFVASGSSHATGAVPDPGATSGILRYLREDASWATAVSDVTIAMPAEFTVSAGITTSGTITVTRNTQSANLFLAGPTSGAAAIPAYRSVVPADIPTLDLVRGPTAAVALGTQRITGLGDPTAAQDAATRNYVDIGITALPLKPLATVVASTALPAYTYNNGTAGVGATITATTPAILAVDGRDCVLNDIILVAGETGGNAPYNGLYTLTTAGTGGVAAVLTRHTYMDTAGEFVGATVHVATGTAGAGSAWLCTNLVAPTVGTTNITFVELNKGADLVAGNGIAITGNSVAVSAGYTGGPNISTVNTISNGTWQGTKVAVGFGGTGCTTVSEIRTLIGAYVAKYQALIGDGATNPLVIHQATHNCGLLDPASNISLNVQIFLAASPYTQVFPDIAVNPLNGDVTITFDSTMIPTGGQYRAVITG